MGLLETEILYGAIAFLRVGGVLFAIPIFGDHPIPVRTRILLAVAVTFGVFPLIEAEWFAPLPTSIEAACFLVVRELFVGVVIGYVAKLAFDAILMAASIVGYQMGFGTANLMLADQYQQVNAFEAFHKMLTMLIFLMLNLHIYFFKVIADSFKYIPMGLAQVPGDLLTFLTALSSGFFVTGVKLAAPVLVSLMFTMAALGLIARAVPQMNIFTMSFPASFFIGLFVYIATIPFFPEWYKSYFEKMYVNLNQLVHGLTSGI